MFQPDLKPVEISQIKQKKGFFHEKTINLQQS